MAKKYVSVNVRPHVRENLKKIAELYNINLCDVVDIAAGELLKALEDNESDADNRRTEQGEETA